MSLLTYYETMKIIHRPVEAENCYAITYLLVSMGNCKTFLLIVIGWYVNLRVIYIPLDINISFSHTKRQYEFGTICLCNFFSASFSLLVYLFVFPSILTYIILTHKNFFLITLSFPCSSAYLNSFWL